MTKLESDITWAVGICGLFFMGLFMMFVLCLSVVNKNEKEREELISQNLIGKTIQSYEDGGNNFHVRFTDGSTTTFHAGKYTIHLK